MNLQAPIQQLQQIMDHEADSLLLQEISELSEKIREEKFYLVVVGMFKRGKSTLINALLGRELAPVAVTPLTALITLFEYGPETKAEVSFLDGSVQGIAITDIQTYVAEEENPGNVKKVAYVKIYDPATLLRHISLVDTPGLGSTFEHNTSTTLSFIPKIDAALFVLSADTPVSKADLEFLEQLQQSVPRIVFVLNKADLLQAQELQRMLEYNRQVVAKALKIPENGLEFIPLSGRLAQQDAAHTLPLREKIRELASHEKEHILQQSVSNQFRLLCDQARMQLRLRLDALQMPLQELEEKQAKLKESIELMQTQRSEFESIISMRVKAIQQEVDEQINTLAGHLRKILHEQLIIKWKAAYAALQQEGTEACQERQTHAIIREFGQAREKLEQRTKAQFRQLLETYCSRSQTFLNELSHHLESLLGMDFGLVAAKFDLDVYTAFYFNYGKGASVDYLHPSFLAGRLSGAQRNFMRKLYEHYNQLLIINSSGVIYDLRYKIQESFRKFNYDLNQHLQNLLTSIENIIRDTIAMRMDTGQASEQDMSQLKAKLVAIESLAK